MFFSKPQLSILSLGGIAVNKNMYVYETERDIIVVDCGVAFPNENLPGIDLVIPDVSYLAAKKGKIRGIFLTHGHEDHRGALPYVLPQLPRTPVYGTKLTVGLSRIRCDEAKVKADWRSVAYQQPISAGDFSVEFVHVTHSIPDAAALLIRTPAGLILHAADFKFDWTPVDGFPTQVQKIAAAGKEGISCLLSDCLRVEKEGYTLSENTIKGTFDEQMGKCPGKFILTTQSSNIGRIQQAVDVACGHNRLIVFAGRSIEQNAEVAVRLGYLKLPRGSVVRTEEVGRFPADKLMILATGSLGQDNAALARMANGEHEIKINEGDFVVFSQDPIPGSEVAVNELVDTLVRAGAEVYYSAILDDLHVSGHEAAGGLRLMLALSRPKYVWPIGGTMRHLKHYARLAAGMGYKKEQIILPDEGQLVNFAGGRVALGKKVETRNVFIDGLGVGDVGNVVLRDRRTMAADGIVMITIPIEKATGEIVGDVDIVSRGFVYMKESGELMGEAKEVIRAVLRDHRATSDSRFLRHHVTDELEKFFFASTRRRPLILPVMVEI